MDLSPGDIVPNSYLVRLNYSPLQSCEDNFANANMHMDWLGNIIKNAEGTNKVTHMFSLAFLGYGGEFTESVIDEIRNRPEVEYVENNRVGGLALAKV